MERQREARALTRSASSDDVPTWAGVIREALSDADRRIVREAHDEIVASPLPEARRPTGCLAAGAGLALLLGWPAIREALPGGGFVSPFVVLAGIVLVGGGFVSALMIGRRGRAANAAVEAAVRHLEAAPGRAGRDAAARAPELSDDRAVDLRAATLLVSHAWVSGDPGAARTFEPEAVAGRIRARLPLVLAVQDLLSAELGARVPFGHDPR